MTKTAKKPRKTEKKATPEAVVLGINPEKIEKISPEQIVTNQKNPRKSAPTLVDMGYGIFTQLEGSDRAPLVTLALSKSEDDKKEFVKLIETFEPEIVTLANSMGTRGQLQPARVRPRTEGGTFDLVFGCRRLLAWLYLSCLNGQMYPLYSTVAEVGDDEAAYQAFDENTCRRPMNPIEQAEWIRSLGSQGLDKEEIKKHTNLDSQVQRQRLLLLKLDQKRQDEVASGELGVVKALQIVQGKAASGGGGRVQKGGKPGGKPGERRKAPTLGEWQDIYENREGLNEKVREFIALEVLQVPYITWAALQKEKKKVAESAATLDK